MATCSPLSLFGVDATGAVADRLDWTQGVTQGAVEAAREAADALTDIGFDPIPIPHVQVGDYQYTSFERPDRPTFQPTTVDMSGRPDKPEMVDVDMGAFDGIERPDIEIPDAPDVAIPASPELVTPPRPEGAPSFQEPEMPTFEAEELPKVPDLQELQIPDAPEINLEDFDVSRPDFDLPTDHIYDNNFYGDTKAQADRYIQWYRDMDPDGELLREKWQEMLTEGLALPREVEQALFDRAVGRDEVSTIQATAQARSEWSSRGFSLPGTTVLAREGEIRRQALQERGRLNREITIQVHEQQLETIRQAVAQGVQLESQRFEQAIRVLDSAQSIVAGHYDVARSLLQARVEMLRVSLEIYQADIQAFRERVQIELSRLEVFRSLLEAERIRGEINEQRVNLYQAQLQGVLANVEVFKARIDGVNGLIQAQVSQMDMYRSRIEAYRSEWEGERTKFDVYATRVNAEEARTRLYEAQVRAFSERVGAYRTEVDAAGTVVDAQSRVNEAQTRQYSTEVDAWRTSVGANIERLQAAIEEFRAQTGMYSAEVTAEEARVRGESNNVRLALDEARYRIEAELKRVDQKIEQMRISETMGMQALQSSAQVHSQLAASAMSAVNVSAGISHGFNESRQRSQSCTESYNYSGDI